MYPDDGERTSACGARESGMYRDKAQRKAPPTLGVVDTHRTSRTPRAEVRDGDIGHVESKVGELRPSGEGRSKASLPNGGLRCLRHARGASPQHTTMIDSPTPNTTALVVAHPGHELRVYHWLEKHHPIYCCLTDGSGGGATSRLPSTTRLLNTVGASVGPIYGRYPDTLVYRLLLDGRVDVFVTLAEELAEALATANVDCVGGDAVEGFNPAHDVCRLIVDGAVEISAGGPDARCATMNSCSMAHPTALSGIGCRSPR